MTDMPRQPGPFDPSSGPPSPAPGPQQPQPAKGGFGHRDPVQPGGWGAPIAPLTLESLPPELRPALPIQERDYFAFWRAPRYRWWKSLLALAMAAVLFLMLSTIGLFVGFAIDGVDAMQVALTGVVPGGPGVFLANNVSLGLVVPVAMLTAWACVQQRPRWLTSVTGGMRWGWFWLLLGVLAPLWAVLIGVTSVLGAPMELALRPYTVILIVGIVITTPFQAAGEEYLVRGLLGRLVGAWFPAPAVGFAASTVATALVFMALHGAGDPWLNLFYLAFGLAGSWLTWRTGGLEAAIAVHLVNNMFSEALLPFMDISGLFDRRDGAGDASILINVGVLIIAVVVIELLARRRGLTTRNDPGRLELDALLGGASQTPRRGEHRG